MYIKTLLSQRDPKWAGVEVGHSKRVIGQIGCTITSLAMLMGNTPDTLAKTLKFTDDGRIDWTSVVFPTLRFEFRDYSRNDTKIGLYIKDPKKAVIAVVNSGAHWVIPVAQFPDGSYICADPWTGTYENLLVKYHNIVGAAYFVGG